MQRGRSLTLICQAKAFRDVTESSARVFHSLCRPQKIKDLITRYYRPRPLRVGHRGTTLHLQTTPSCVRKPQLQKSILDKPKKRRRRRTAERARCWQWIRFSTSEIMRHFLKVSDVGVLKPLTHHAVKYASPRDRNFEFSVALFSN